MGQDLLCSRYTVFYSQVVDNELSFLKRDSVIVKSVFISLKTHGIYIPVKVACNMYNPTAALMDEVRCHVIGGFAVIDDNIRAIRVFKNTVKEDQWDVSVNETLEMVNIRCCIGERNQ